MRFIARKKIDKATEYVVTRIGYCVAGQVDKARALAHRLQPLRTDIWNKYGSLAAWGKKGEVLYKQFKQTNPPALYQLDYKNWERTFLTVIDDIHAVQAAAKTAVIRRIYRMFKPEETNPSSSFRDELVSSLKDLTWMDYPLLHRWIRDAYHRGHSAVNNQICLTAKGGAKIRRVSRNCVEITFNGLLLPGKKNRYEKVTLKFKVGRCSPTGNFRIIFDDVTGKIELHYPKKVKRSQLRGSGEIGLDKGYTEAFVDSKGKKYGEGIGQIMTRATENRHRRGKARNRLWQIAQKPGKEHIHHCNLGKKKWNQYEERKRRQLTTIIRTGTNQIFNQYSTAVVEDLSFHVKGKKRAKSLNRKLSEWCKKELQKAVEEISYRNNCQVVTENAAYTSQVDSRHGVLLGTRSGDSFFTFDGEVLQADRNAATNIEARKNDRDITRYMKAVDVRCVLVKRTASFLSRMDLTIDDAIEKGWFDPKHLRGLSGEIVGKAEARVESQ
ncbi:MAG: transposase [Xenococcaceae cyanobacterium]